MYSCVIASSPGRVCFAGEDIDWISGPSILCAIDLRVWVKVTPLPPNYDFIILKSGYPFDIEYLIPLTDIGNYKKHVMDYVHAAVKIIRDTGIIITPLKISVSSQLPARAGLSSSAAVSVATIAALSKFFNLKLSTYEICNLAYSIENKDLKTGAGQMDFYACGLGGLLYINSATVPPNPIEKYNIPSDLNILIIDTKTPHNTSDVIRLKRQRFAQSDPQIIEYVKHTEVAIEQMRTLLKQNKPSINEISALVSSCHNYLRDYMMVSTDLINTCIEICLKKGAIGAKLTGAGMGGCLFALVSNSVVNQIKEALSEYPVKIYVTNISHQGLIVQNQINKQHILTDYNSHINGD